MVDRADDFNDRIDDAEDRQPHHVSDKDERIEVEAEGVSVGEPKAKNILVVAVLAVAGVYFMYKMTFGAADEKRAKEEMKKAEIVKEGTEQDIERPPSLADIGENIGIVKAPELPEIASAFSDGSQENGLGAAPVPPAIGLQESDDLFKGIFVDEGAEVKKATGADKKPEGEEEQLEIFSPDKVNLVIDDLPPKEEPKRPAIDEAAEREKRRKELEEAEKKRQKRLQSYYEQPMLVEYNGAVPTNPVTEGGLTPPKHTKSMQIAATTVGDSDLTVGQGRMIEAVLESAINTDLPGYVRAVVSRDVYSENGRNVLIPKGSRLVGQYGRELGPDQNRLAIAWTRIMRTDGIDVNLAETPFGATDQLGRAGIHGIVDRKYLELFSSSALLSILTVGGAIIAEKISDEDNPTTSSTTTNNDGSITNTTNRSASDEAILSAVQRMGNSVGGAIDSAYGKAPTLIVAQGTRVRVYVQADVVFPKGNLRYIE
jgi:type IV secretory pathway VirB10-like protein